MTFDLTGKLLEKYETVQKKETFRTRDFILEVSEDFNGRTIVNYIRFQLTQDKTAILDRFSLGDTIKVHFNIRGNKWERNGQVSYFTNLDAWRIEAAGMQGQVPGGAMPALESERPALGDTPDDLPF